MSKQDRVDIAVLLTRFDFRRVHECMVGMRWQWHVGNARRRRVPSLTRIREFATEVLQHAATMQTGWVSSGGFRAGRDDHGRLGLTFEVEGLYASEMEEIEL